VTYPTTLSPWFVIARVKVLDSGEIEYYTMVGCEDITSPPRFTLNKKEAMLFTNLASAKRVRDSDVDCLIVVLCTKEDLREYGR
jgi:hypothetical protein